MPITSDHAGRRYPATKPYEITAAKVAEFAEVVGAPTDQVPPTLAIIVANHAWEALFADPELGLELKRIVHGEQKFSYQRPLVVGDVITGTTVIDRVTNRGGTDMIYATVELATVTGEAVGTAVATLIHTPEANHG